MRLLCGFIVVLSTLLRPRILRNLIARLRRWHRNDQSFIDRLSTRIIGIQRAAHVFLWAKDALITMIRPSDYVQHHVGSIERLTQRVAIFLQYGVADIVYQVKLLDLDKRRRCMRSLYPNPAFPHRQVSSWERPKLRVSRLRNDEVFDMY